MADSNTWGAGDPASWRTSGSAVVDGVTVPLIHGEGAHSRSDNNVYAIIGGEAVAFDGHRLLLDVNFSSRNYLKTSGMSGDEVRRGGTCTIKADGVVVFSFSYRELDWAMRKAQTVIEQLSEGGADFLSKESRDKLVGRKVYYMNHPAVVTRVVTDQGCVILEAADGTKFPKPPWHSSSEDDEYSRVVKVEVTDAHIWWWRDDPIDN